MCRQAEVSSQWIWRERGEIWKSGNKRYVKNDILCKYWTYERRDFLLAQMKTPISDSAAVTYREKCKSPIIGSDC